MSKILRDPHPVKLFVGMLSQDASLFDQLLEKLRELFGPSDIESSVWQWQHSAYYEKEMGADLKRKFVFFEKLINPQTISGIKLKTIELEKQCLNESGGRGINLDPGYLDSAKIVLVSTKDYSHRLYLGNGIYGEVTLIYSGKSYQVLPYTYPDFRTEEYHDIFKKARELFKKNPR
ncbi:MAG: DUF4416 family protein [Nitrospirae bacterium]|nr:DUF4416 family protein [Nitrospirota bacterium]